MGSFIISLNSSEAADKSFEDDNVVNDNDDDDDVDGDGNDDDDSNFVSVSVMVLVSIWAALAAAA